MPAISTVPSAISGTSRANSFLTRLGWVRESITCGSAHALADADDQALDAGAVGVVLARDALPRRQQRLERAEVDHHVVGVATLLDHAGDDVALLAGELPELALVLGVAQPLQHDLLRRRGGDPAEAGRGVVVLADDARPRRRRSWATTVTWPGLAVELDAGVLLGPWLFWYAVSSACSMASTSTSNGISFSRSSMRSRFMSMSISDSFFELDLDLGLRRRRRRRSAAAIRPVDVEHGARRRRRPAAGR